MPIIDRTFLNNDDQCCCGRLMREVHCVDCGSFNIEGKRKSDFIPVESTGENGGKVFKKFEIKRYTCRRCGFAFNDRQRYNQECKATPPQLSVKAQRTADKIEVSLRDVPDDVRRAKLEELFNKTKKQEDNK